MPATTQADIPNAPSIIANPIPPLVHGDRLTRAEFERRFDAMPGLKKAELLEGVVYMSSPVRFEHHGEPHFQIIGWLSRYSSMTPGVRGGDNGSVRLDLENEPQPDAFLILAAECGGQAVIDADDYIVGAPELVVEVSGSTAGIDLGIKWKVYLRNGVKEYIVLRMEDRAIEWFVLGDGKYQPLTAEEGIYRSRVFPGLWLDAPAMIRGDLPQVNAVLDRGLASTEYREFRDKIRSTLKR